MSSRLMVQVRQPTVREGTSHRDSPATSWPIVLLFVALCECGHFGRSEACAAHRIHACHAMETTSYYLPTYPTLPCSVLCLNECKLYMLEPPCATGPPAAGQDFSNDAIPPPASSSIGQLKAKPTSAGKGPNFGPFGAACSRPSPFSRAPMLHPPRSCCALHAKLLPFFDLASPIFPLTSRLRSSNFPNLEPGGCALLFVLFRFLQFGVIASPLLSSCPVSSCLVFDSS
jgi:hypothetical protein